LVLAQVEDGDRVGVMEGRGDARLAEDPLDGAARIGRALGPRGAEDLEGDLAAQERVVGAVNLAHATLPEQRFDRVATKLGARLETHGMDTTLNVEEGRVEEGTGCRTRPRPACGLARCSAGSRGRAPGRW